MKAILEFEAPKSCADCPLEYVSSNYNAFPTHCHIIGLSSTDYFTDTYKTIRAPFCPLKIVEDISINESPTDLVTEFRKLEDIVNAYKKIRIDKIPYGVRFEVDIKNGFAYNSPTLSEAISAAWERLNREKEITP